MKSISFYKSILGNCPVEDHLNSLSDTQVAKITWVLKLIRETQNISTKYFKKLVNTDDIWEVRVSVGKNNFRLLGFQDRELIILTNSFQKKTQKTPSKEIKLAERRKKEYSNRR
jgi:phage-related protein